MPISANCTTVTAGLATAGDTVLNSSPVLRSATALTDQRRGSTASNICEHPNHRARLSSFRTYRICCTATYPEG
jgi:hypothetical protein